MKEVLNKIPLVTSTQSSPRLADRAVMPDLEGSYLPRQQLRDLSDMPQSNRAATPVSHMAHTVRINSQWVGYGDRHPRRVNVLSHINWVGPGHMVMGGQQHLTVPIASPIVPDFLCLTTVSVLLIHIKRYDYTVRQYIARHSQVLHHQNFHFRASFALREVLLPKHETRKEKTCRQEFPQLTALQHSCCLSFP
jgi:hypothetical protein